MSQNKNIIITLIATFISLFATTFLLDVPIINQSIPRIAIVYLLLFTELGLGVLILKLLIKK